MNRESAESLPRLPVIVSVLQAYGSVLGRPYRLFTLAALPAALCIALSGASLWTPWQEQPFAVLYFSILLIPMSYLGLRWTYQTQGGDWLKGQTDQLSITAHAKVLVCFIFWAVCLYLWPIIPLAALFLLAYGLAGPQGGLSVVLPFVPILWLCLAAFGLIPFARFFFALPLIAAHQPASPRAAWNAGAGAGLRIGVAVFLLTTTFAMFAALCLLALTELILILMGSTVLDTALHDSYFLRYQVQWYLLVWLILPLGSVAGTALFAELLASAYRATANRMSAPARGVLERFD